MIKRQEQQVALWSNNGEDFEQCRGIVYLSVLMPKDKRSSVCVSVRQRERERH